MSSILYYSNYCNHSKSLLQLLSKSDVAKEVHFICIDNRQKDQTGRTLIVLQNGEKIVMPPNVTKVPALLLLKENYRVVYGDEITKYLKPRQVEVIKQATFNNMEPMAFGFGGFSQSITSDNYSFLDMDAEDLTTKGNGGIRQMHSYSTIHENSTIPTPDEGGQYTSSSDLGKIKDSDSMMEAYQRQRDNDLANIKYRTGPQ
jgi:hypothetical protein